MLAGLGQVKAGNARINCARFCPRNGDDYRIGANPRPRKHGLRLGLWDDESPGSEPWWNADRRAPPAGGAAVPAARQVEESVCRRSISFRFCVLLRCGRSGRSAGKSRHHPFFSLSAAVFRLSTWRSPQARTPMRAGNGDAYPSTCWCGGVSSGQQSLQTCRQKRKVPPLAPSLGLWSAASPPGRVGFRRVGVSSGEDVWTQARPSAFASF